MRAAELRRGDRVRVRGLYRSRRVRMLLDRDPVQVDSGDWLLCGYEPTEGKRGRRRRFQTRFVTDDEDVEVLQKAEPRWRRVAGTNRVQVIPR